MEVQCVQLIVLYNCQLFSWPNIFQKEKVEEEEGKKI